MDGLCAGFEPDAVSAALAHDLRLCELQVTGCGRNDTVALSAHVVECAADMLIVGLNAPHVREEGDKLSVAVQRNARLLTDHLWQSNISGKPIYTIAQEGVEEKLSCLPTKAVGKLQETLQRVVNEGSGTLICIIL